MRGGRDDHGRPRRAGGTRWGPPITGPVFVGYFPKRRIDPAEAGLPDLDDLCSISQCLADGPPDWVQAWLHNELGFYDSVELAASLIPEGEAARYEVFGYRLHPVVFDDGERSAWEIPPVAASGPPPGWASLGFDAVSRSSSSFFECSPLTCNGGAATMPHNEHGLFPTLDDALAGAASFSAGPWEPGPYYVAEVLRGLA